MTFTKADYQEALKKISKQDKENFLMINFRYDRQIIVPYKEGIAIMQSLENGMLFESNYSSPPSYKPITDEITVQLVPSEMVNDIKVAKLLNISMDAAKSIREST